MSKVYEALHYVHAERNLVAQFQNDPSRKNRTLKKSIAQEFPPRRMEREMTQLYHGITTLLPQVPKPIIQFIGARKGEGTSTVVWEYGCLIAEKMNKTVLIVDGEKNTIPHHQALGIQPTISLQELLREELPLNASFPKDKDHRLFLCGMGREDQFQPLSNVLGNEKENWTKILARFDCVLIDSPPLSFSDAAMSFCAIVDGVVIVVGAETSRAPVVHNLKDHIVRSGGNTLGVVFNNQRHHIPEWVYKFL